MSASPAVRSKPNGGGYCSNNKSNNFLHPNKSYGLHLGLSYLFES